MKVKGLDAHDATGSNVGFLQVISQSCPTGLTSHQLGQLGEVTEPRQTPVLFSRKQIITAKQLPEGGCEKLNNTCEALSTGLAQRGSHTPDHRMTALFQGHLGHSLTPDKDLPALERGPVL